MKYSSTNRPLVAMAIRNQCYQKSGTMTIRGVLWHSTGANNKTLRRYVEPDDTDPNRQAILNFIGKNSGGNDWNTALPGGRAVCVHAFIGVAADNATVSTVQILPWDVVPYGCGSGGRGSCNSGWIQFEICEDNLTDPVYFNAVYKEACELTAYLCKMFGLDPTKTVSYAGINVPVITTHCEAHDLGLGSNHGDVLHWFPKHGVNMDNVRRDVASLMNADRSNISVAGTKSTSVNVAQMSATLASASLYTPRLTAPEAGNKYYITKSAGGYSPCRTGKYGNGVGALSGLPDPGCNVLPNCVGYAVGRFNEIGGYGECKYLGSVNGGQMMSAAGSCETSTTTPRLGACVVWGANGDGYGHVAIVEQINADGSIVTSESGWESKSKFWTKNRSAGGNWGAGPQYRFKGFIYNPAVTGDMVSAGAFYASQQPLTWQSLGINPDNLKPFIVTVPPDVIDLDYAKLQSMNVTGFMFEAGQCFEDGSHLKRKVFRAKNLKRQVEDCNKNGFLFALYTKVLARNVQEAEEELKQLYYTVSRYPPGLGIWLQLGFRKTQSKDVNHKILDKYWERLSQWGLMQGSGLYVTKDELDLIDWDAYKYKYLLWLRDYCQSMDECIDVADKNTIISQDFFKFDYTRTEEPEVEPEWLI